MAAIKSLAVKPSRAFQTEFEKAKKGGINVTEYKKLQNLAASDIRKSPRPQSLAALYTGEFKGWQAKGLVKKDPRISAEASRFTFNALADKKSITEGAKYLKANAAQLIAKYPNLKDIDFKKTSIGDFGDAFYMSLVDKKGKPVMEDDRRIATLRQILGSSYKTVFVGVPHP